MQNMCFRQFVQNMSFHEWAPYGRWGGDRTVKIHIVAMRVLYISFILYKETVCHPVDVSWFFVILVACSKK